MICSEGHITVKTTSLGPDRGRYSSTEGTRPLGGSGGMPPPELFEIQSLGNAISCILRDDFLEILMFQNVCLAFVMITTEGRLETNIQTCGPDQTNSRAAIQASLLALCYLCMQVIYYNTKYTLNPLRVNLISNLKDRLVHLNLFNLDLVFFFKYKCDVIPINLSN